MSDFTIVQLERFLALAPIAKITYEKDPHPKFPDGHVIVWIEDEKEDDGYRWSRFASLQDMMEKASVHPTLAHFFEELEARDRK